HGDGAYAKGGTLNDRLIEVTLVVQVSVCVASGDRVIQIDHHDDSDLGGDASQCDESHCGGDRHVVAEEVHQPEAADERKGQRRHDEPGIAEAAKGEIQQYKDDPQRGRHDDFEPLNGPCEILELTGPGDRVTGR